MLFKEDTVYVYKGIGIHYCQDGYYFAIVRDEPPLPHTIKIEAPTQMALFHQLSNLGF